MKNQWRRCASAASVVGIAALVMASPAAAALDKCQAAIEKEVIKLESKVFGVLAKCVDKYRKSNEAGQFGTALADEAAWCEGQLAKGPVFTGGSGTSAMDKAFAKLSTLVSGAKCTNDELQRLGHIREDIGTPGDTWARITLLRAYKSALDTLLGATGDGLLAFVELFDSDAGASCPTCGTLKKGGPCFTHACKVGGASGACVESHAADIPVTLAGSYMFTICDSSILSGAYAVFGGQGKGLEAVNLGGGTFACVSASRSEGWISKCTGATQKQVDYKQCQDHLVGAPETNECPGTEPGGYSSYSCGPDRPDAELDGSNNPAHPGITNGGNCLSTKLSAPAAGEGFIMNTTQINVVYATQEGPDGVYCTADDTGKPGNPGTSPLTTGQGEAEVRDADTTNALMLPNDSLSAACPNPAVASGAGFDCTQVTASNLGGGTFAGAFQSLHGLFGPPRVDTVTTFSLECQ